MNTGTIVINQATTPLCGGDRAKEALKRGENPYGKEEPKREAFDSYWAWEGNKLQWFWWQLELGLVK